MSETITVPRTEWEYVKALAEFGALAAAFAISRTPGLSADDPPASFDDLIGHAVLQAADHAQGERQADVVAASQWMARELRGVYPGTR